MGVISLSHFIPNLKFSMSDATKHLVNNGNLYLSYGLVVMLIGLTWFFADKVINMQNQIIMLSANQIRTDSKLEVMESQMVTKDIFNLTMENFGLKLDQALGLNKNK